MRKIISKIAGLMLGLSLAAGVGVALGGAKRTAAVRADQVTMAYSAGSTTNMTGGNDAATVGLDASEWSVVAAKGGNSNFPGLNKSNYIALYYHASGSNTITVTNSLGKTIDSITISFTTSTYNNVGVSVGGSTVSGSSGTYQINATSFVLTNANTSNVQVRITSVVINYTGTTESYTVSFNGNGASGSMADVTDISGSYTLPANGFSAPSGKAFAGWKANNTGSILAAGSSYTVTEDVEFYAQWADSYSVTYTAGANGSGSYVHSSQPSGSYILPAFSSLTGITASTGYRFANYTVGGVTKNPGDSITLNADTSVTVNFEIQPLEATYDFVSNFSTYGGSWGTGYGDKTIDGSDDLGSEYDATIVLARANKQSSGVGSDRPYICGNTNSDALSITFTLNDSSYKISSVEVSFEPRGTNAPVVKLFKGTAVSGSALDTATIGTKNTLSYDNLNDVSFCVSINAGGTSNKGAGLNSIVIGLAQQESFGTLDHIKVTSLPTLVYHVGESFSSNGLSVFAYDAVDEDTASFKEITNDVTLSISNGHVFDENDIPSVECVVSYSEDEINKETSFTVYVYALAEYELVTSEPSDWSGQYLIVGLNSETYLAMNGALSQIDVEGNHKTVAPDSNNVIENGQELEWTIASYSTGYSICGKSGTYIGWASGSNNGLTGSSTPLVNTISISGSDVTIQGSGGRNLSLNTDGNARFRYYTSGTVQLYRLKVSDNADAYAQLFLGAFTCDSTGENAPTFTIKEGSTYWSWSLLEDEYDNLTAVEKEQFRLGVPSKTGTNIEQALARYDLVVRKYGWDNFMSRSISAGAPMVHPVATSNSSTIIIVVVALTSITSIGVLLVIKRKRSLVK